MEQTRRQMESPWSGLDRAATIGAPEPLADLAVA